MTSFIGNNIRPKGIGLIPSRKVIDGGYKTIIGNGSGLFSRSLPFKLASFTNASPRYINHNNVLSGPFAGGVPAIRKIGSRNYIQLESAKDCKNSYSEDLNSQFTTQNEVTINDDVTTDPLGNSVADELIESTNNDEHYCSYNYDFTDATPAIICGYAKVKTGRTTFAVSVDDTAFADYTGTQFDMSDGSTATADGCVAPGSVYFKQVQNGWWYWAIRVVPNATATSAVRIHLNDTVAYAGTSGYGIYLWGYDFFDSTILLQSSIKATGSPVTRTKCEFYYPEANIPSWVRDGFTIRLAFNMYGSTDYAVFGAPLFIYLADAAAAQLYSVLSADLRVKLYVSGVGLVCQSDVLEWSLGQIITVTYIYNNGANSQIIISGATSGNGTNNGTQCSAVDGDIYWGMDDVFNYQIRALLSEPEPL